MGREIIYLFVAKIAMPATNAAIAVLILWQVIGRYLFNNPPSWCEEVARIAMIWMTFLGMSLTYTHGKEITMKGVLSFLGPGVRKWTGVLKDLILIAFLLCLCYQSVKIAYVDRYINTAALDISWGFIYLALSCGLILYLAAIGKDLFRRFVENRKVAICVALVLLFFYIVFTKKHVFSGSGFSLTALTPVVMLFLFAIEMPVGFALGCTCFYYLMFHSEIPLMLMPRSFTHGINSFTIMALPLFILAAEIMNKAGITGYIVRFIMNIFGHIRGGIGHVSVVSNMVMAGMSGSSLADTAATGVILIPEMEKKGFSKGFASSIIVASGAIGPVIPPSIPFIIYGGLAHVSVYKLFMAGALPGIIMGVFFMIVIYYISTKRAYPVQARATALEMCRSFMVALPSLLLPVVVIGGMVFGFFTPTEAGSIAIFLAIVLGISYRKLTVGVLWECLSGTAITVSSILIIIAMANLTSYIANLSQIPGLVTEMLLSLSSSPAVALLIINIFVLVLGCFEAIVPIMIIGTPILVPALSKIGVDPIHFGVVFVINTLIGMMTPPYGISLFLVSGISGVSIKALIKDMWPFIVSMVILLGLLTYFPGIVLFLPNLLG